MSRVVAVLAACAACGDGAAGPADGPGHGDALAGAPDAPTPVDAAAGVDAGPEGNVRITIEPTLGLPIAGQTVLFLDDAGALLATRVTDAAGHTSADVPTGGSAFVLWDPAAIGVLPASRATTVAFLGLEPGDYHVFVPPVVAPGSTLLDLTVPSYPTADGFFATSGCGSVFETDPVLAVPVGGCGDSGDLSVVAMMGSTQLASLYAAGVDFTAPQVLAGPYLPVVAQTVSLTHVPADVVQVSILHARTTPQIERAGALFNGTVAVAGGNASLSGSISSITGADMTTELALDAPNSTARVKISGDYAVNPTLDLMFLVVRPIAPSFDAATRHFGWDETGANAAQRVYAVVGFDRAGEDRALVVSSPHATGYQLDVPALPAGYEDWAVQPTDAVAETRLSLGVTNDLAQLQAMAERPTTYFESPPPAAQDAYFVISTAVD